jgi:hypothetical protein
MTSGRMVNKKLYVLLKNQVTFKGFEGVRALTIMLCYFWNRVHYELIIAIVRFQIPPYPPFLKGGY